MILPDLRKAQVEKQLQSFKSEVLDISRRYRRENCDKNGKMLTKNFSEEIESGVRELRNMTKSNSDQMVVLSDKSSKSCLMTKNNYVSCVEQHISNDRKIVPKEIHTTEKLLNGHAVQFARSVGLCAQRASDQRLKSALINNEIKPPPLYCLIKDHKNIQEGQPIPSRPVCGATESQTGPLGNILTDILNSTADIISSTQHTECDSTEDMIASMCSTNNTIQEQSISNAVLFSTDVVALYPNITSDLSASIARQMIIESGITFHGMNVVEAALHLVLTLTDEEQIDFEREFPSILPVRKNKGGPRPGITTREVLDRSMDDRNNAKSLFNHSSIIPSELQCRKIMAKCVEIAIRVCMKNHAYTFNQETYLQEEGGSIGERFTQALARVVMIKWDQEFLALARANSIQVLMYKRYVDDGNQCVVALPPGTRWCDTERRMIMKEECVSSDEEEQPDLRSMREIVKMGSSINPMIQLTGDCPTKNNQDMMPVLDLACWIEDGMIWWQHYHKPMTNFYLIMANSAMSWKVKRTALTQEVVRILRNCKIELPWEKKVVHLNELTARMKASGYSAEFRFQVIKAGIAGFDKMVENEKAGGRPVNRPRSWNAQARKSEKFKKKLTWHKSGKYDVPLFVPYTPNSMLAREIKAVSDRRMKNGASINFKIVESGGVPLKSIFHRSDPWDNVKCGRSDCFPCQKDSGGSCRRSGVTYQILCLECKNNGIVAQYKGESGRNMYCRGKEHLSDLRKKSKSSPLWKHCLEVHGGDIVDFKMELTGKFNTPLARQVMEGIHITHFKGNIMNSKAEWRQPAIAQVSISRSNPE